MATTSRMKGLDELLRLFDTLPAATEQELREELPKIGAQMLAAQKEVVPVRTGDLWRGLTTVVLNGGLKVRVGLVGNTSGRTGKTTYGLFYGRFVEFGRRGQVVLVQRRRRVKGRLRSSRGRKRSEDIVASYSMKVRPEPARPFVYSPGALAAELTAIERLAAFWDSKLAESA